MKAAPDGKAVPVGKADISGPPGCTVRERLAVGELFGEWKCSLPLNLKPDGKAAPEGKAAPDENAMSDGKAEVLETPWLY